MKFLLVHQNFPGQFLHIVRNLIEARRHEIVFLTEPNPNHITGVRKVPYRKPPTASGDAHPAVRELDGGVKRADAVFQVASGLKSLGFEPDIIIGHHGWGEMLNLVDIWPGTPMSGYFEFYYNPDRADVGFDPEFPTNSLDNPRMWAKNAINHIALNLEQHGHSPTRWQWSTYPSWARERIDILWQGVDLDVCRPDPAARRKPLTIGGVTVKPTDKLVTYVSRDLEPYRGFYLIMRKLPHLLRARKDLKVIMVGSDGVSYGVMPPEGGVWRDRMMKEVGHQIDLSRVAFPGRVNYVDYLASMKRSDAHVYLTYPFVASWSLRESQALGCGVVGSDSRPVREFITDGINGVLASFFDPRGLADKVLEVLENKDLNARLRANARDYAVKNLAMADYIAQYRAVIERLVGKEIDPPQTTPRRPAKAKHATGTGAAKAPPPKAAPKRRSVASRAG